MANMEPHCWVMTGQDDERTYWTCTTHSPPCHSTKYDGKGSSAYHNNTAR